MSVNFIFPSLTVSCTEGEVRLADGTNSTSGRVETCIGSKWYTVCDKSFSNSEGRVACRGLGLHADGTIQSSYSRPSLI